MANIFRRWNISRQTSLPSSSPPPPPPLQPLLDPTFSIHSQNSASTIVGNATDSSFVGAGDAVKSHLAKTSPSVSPAVNDDKPKCTGTNGHSSSASARPSNLMSNAEELSSAALVANDNALISPDTDSSNLTLSTARLSIPLRQQLSRPFIPPSFPAPLNGDGLIKPSEYLRTMKSNSNSVSFSISGSKAGSLAASREDLTMDEASSSSSSSTHDDDQISSTSSNDSGIVAGPISPRMRGSGDIPLPPPLPDDGIDGKTNSVTNHISTTPQINGPSNSNGNGSQPLGAIRLQDLQSVQLKRTEHKAHDAIKPKGLTSASSSENLLDSKTHLIEELKMSKDIQGIKKLKEEKAKKTVEEEKMRKTELSKIYSPENFVDEIPEVDPSGAPIPPWKRQMLAKKAAERAKKDAEERRQREDAEQRQVSIPAWKRNLLQKKESNLPEIASKVQQAPKTANKVVNSQVIVAANKLKKEPKTNAINPVANAKNPVTNGSNAVTKTESVNAVNSAKNSENVNETHNDGANESRHNNPWMFQLRKTNSKLLLDS